MKIDDKIQILLTQISKLSKIIQMENELLEKPGHQIDLREILEQKQSLISSYEQQAKNVDEDIGLSSVDDALRHRLTEAMESFYALTEENRLRLLAKMEATKRVFTIIQEAVQDYRGSVKTYGDTGTTHNVSHQPFRPAVSVGINQEL